MQKKTKKNTKIEWIPCLELTETILCLCLSEALTPNYSINVREKICGFQYFWLCPLDVDSFFLATLSPKGRHPLEIDDD